MPYQRIAPFVIVNLASLGFRGLSSAAWRNCTPKCCVEKRTVNEESARVVGIVDTWASPSAPSSTHVTRHCSTHLAVRARTYADVRRMGPTPDPRHVPESSPRTPSRLPSVPQLIT